MSEPCTLTFKHGKRDIEIVFTIETIRCYGEPSEPMLAAFNNRLMQVVLASCRTLDAKGAA